MSRTGFRLLDPVKSLRQRLDFLLPAARPRGAAAARAPAPLPDGRGLGRLARARRWPTSCASSSPHNRMLQGGFVIEDRLVTLADIDSPGPDASSARSTRSRPPTRCARSAARRRAPRSTRSRCAPATSASSSARAAHADDLAGGRRLGALARRRRRRCPETSARRARTSRAPDAARRRRPPRRTASSWPPASASALARSVAGRPRRAPRGRVRVLAEEAAGQLPRLARLERLRAATPGSRSGLLLDEQARAAPRTTSSSCSRTARYSQRGGQAPHRQRRPRPDLDRRPPGRARRRADEHAAERARGRRGAQPARRGRGAAAARRRRRARGRARPGARGSSPTPSSPRARPRPAARPGARARRRRRGARPRRAASSTWSASTPTRSSCPPGTAPNPGRARDLAFVLFTGEGERTRANRITNGRWALSAFGTASAAALSDGDTVYSVTPIYHPSGLLMSVGGAIAGGARLAMARDFDPDDVLGRGAPLRRHRRLLHLDDAARARRGARRTRASATTRSGCSSAPACRAACGGASSERFAPGARARVLRLDRGRGDPRQRHRREARLARAGRCRAAPRCGIAAYDVARAGGCSRRRTASRSPPSRGRSGMLLARCADASRPRASPLRGVFERGRRLARRPATCSARRATATSGSSTTSPALIRTAAGAVAAVPDRTTRSATSTRSTSPRPTACRPQGRASLAVAAVTLRDGRTLDGRRPDRRAGAARRRAAGPRSSASSTRSRSPPGTARSPPRCARQGAPLPTKARPAFVALGRFVPQADQGRSRQAAGRRSVRVAWRT